LDSGEFVKLSGVFLEILLTPLEYSGNMLRVDGLTVWNFGGYANVL